MKIFAYGIAAGLLAAFGFLCACYVAMATFAPASIPAPALTKLNLLDEKFRFLRRHPDFDLRILAVGSSITWRQLAGKAFESFAGGPGRLLNGATGYLKIHQTHALADFYLAHYHDVRSLIVMVNLPDFDDCTRQSAVMFHPEDAARYVFDDWPPLYFYLRYFAPRRYIKMAMVLARRQVPFSGDFYIDRYGSGPVQLADTANLGLRYGTIETDPACIKAMYDFAHDIQSRHIDMVLVFTPIHPEYRARYPAATERLMHVASTLKLAQRRNATSLLVLNFIQDPSFVARNFFDAFHLQWPAVKVLSERIVQAMKDEQLLQPNDRVMSRSADNSLARQKPGRGSGVVATSTSGLKL